MPRCVIVAEAGINHFGKLDLAKQLADEALKAGADIVKFQTYVPDKVLRRSDPDFKLLESLALSRAQFKELAKHCEAIGIEFMATPGDSDSLRFLVEELGVERIKIGSDDLTNHRLLSAARYSLLPIILSTGMAALNEVYDAICATTSTNVTVLHCVSLYPTPIEHANIRAILTLRDFLKEWAIPIGYSDHTRLVDSIMTAVALGAVMVEAHLKLDNGQKPIDYAVSFGAMEFAYLVDRVRQVEKLLGSGKKEPCPAEKAQISLLRKGDDGLRGLTGAQLEMAL